MSSARPRILPYDVRPAAVRSYDARSPYVAATIITLIGGVWPAPAEHIGSTAVPGCDGKGNIDLMIPFAQGELDCLTAALDALGFQAWEAPGAHNDGRPVRIGAIDHDGTRFRMHVHCIPASSEEVARQRAFRDRLRGDPELVRAYVAEKHTILERGMTYGPSFGDAKTSFIQGVLRDE